MVGACQAAFLGVVSAVLPAEERPVADGAPEAGGIGEQTLRGMQDPGGKDSGCNSAICDRNWANRTDSTDSRAASSTPEERVP